MNDEHGGIARTLPFTRPRRKPERGAGCAELAAEVGAEMLEIVKQEPDMNISRTILLGKQVGSGRYRVDASRVARKLLEFEAGLHRDQDNGGRSSSSSGRSSASSTSQDGSSS